MEAKRPVTGGMGYFQQMACMGSSEASKDNSSCWQSELEAQYAESMDALVAVE